MAMNFINNLKNRESDGNMDYRSVKCIYEKKNSYDGFTCAQPYRQICDSMPFPTQKNS